MNNGTCRPIDIDRIRELLDYDPDTGTLSWKARPGNARWSKRWAGKTAGSLHDKRGYRSITIDGVDYLSHRVAYAHFHGKQPDALIDHKNRRPSDNRIKNLKPASYSDNSMNRSVTGEIPFRGVSRNGKKYRARIQRGGKMHYLGNFDTPEQAHAAWCAAALADRGADSFYPV